VDDLQKVIQDIHTLMANDPDHAAMPIYAQCLTALTRLQQQRMSAQQQVSQSPGGQLVSALGGGR
jgi:hypothetical protein